MLCRQSSGLPDSWTHRLARTLLLLALLSLAGLSSASADVFYFYDALGRLVQVIDEAGQVATYQYDSVGNLLGIIRSSAAPPQLDIITPAQGEAGSTVPIVITGQNLGLTQGVTTENPAITVGPVSATNEEITTTFTIAPGAPLGPTTVTASNPFGSASIGFTVLETSFHFDGVIATAQSGTPADPAQPSAIIRQTITITGRRLSTLVQFETPRMENGLNQPTPVAYPLTNVNPDGTEGQVTLGAQSGTGVTQLRNAEGPSPESHLLQIVPNLTAVSVPTFAPGETMTLEGFGFTADMIARFPVVGGGTADQPIVAGSVGVANDTAQVVIPEGADEVGQCDIRVVTAGGESGSRCVFD